MAAGDYVSRDYVDARLKAIADQAHTELMGHVVLDDQRYTAQQRALEQAAVNVDRRLEEMNQFREENRRFAGTMLTRDVYDRQHADLVLRLSTLEEDRQRQEGAMGTLRTLLLIVSVPGVLGAIGLLISLLHTGAVTP